MKQLRGYLCIAAAAILWGVSATTVKVLFNRQYDPLIIVQTRVSIAFLVMILYFAVRDPSVLKFRLRDVPLFVFVGVCGVAGSNYFYYFAIKESNVATSILVQYTAPIMVAIYAGVVQREKIGFNVVLALLLSFLGIFLAVGGYDPSILSNNAKGIVFALIAAVAFAIFNLAGRPLTHRYSVWTALMYSLGSATVFWLFIHTPLRILDAHYSAGDWKIFTFISMISILIPYSFYFWGLHFITPSKAIITSTLEPIVAIVSSWIILGGSLSALQLLGALFVIISIVLLQYRSRTTEIPIAQE